MVDIPGAQLADRVIAEKNNAVANMVFELVLLIQIKVEIKNY